MENNSQRGRGGRVNTLPPPDHIAPSHDEGAGGGWRMKVGFTGTREGMTPEQSAAVSTLLARLFPDEVHHGDCIGADEEFHGLAFMSNGERVRRVGHPPKDERFRAFCDFDETREPKPYLVRNRDIVDEPDVVIAAPREMRPPLSLKGHGTWSTYFYAKDKAKKRTYLVLPDGTVREEG